MATNVPMHIVRNPMTAANVTAFNQLFPSNAGTGTIDYSLSDSGVFPSLADVDGNGSHQSRSVEQPSSGW